MDSASFAAALRLQHTPQADEADLMDEVSFASALKRAAEIVAKAFSPQDLAGDSGLAARLLGSEPVQDRLGPRLRPRVDVWAAPYQADHGAGGAHAADQSLGFGNAMPPAIGCAAAACAEATPGVSAAPGGFYSSAMKTPDTLHLCLPQTLDGRLVLPTFAAGSGSTPASQHLLLPSSTPSPRALEQPPAEASSPWHAATSSSSPPQWAQTFATGSQQHFGHHVDAGQGDNVLAPANEGGPAPPPPVAPARALLPASSESVGAAVVAAAFGAGAVASPRPSAAGASPRPSAAPPPLRLRGPERFFYDMSTYTGVNAARTKTSLDTMRSLSASGRRSRNWFNSVHRDKPLGDDASRDRSIQAEEGYEECLQDQGLHGKYFESFRSETHRSRSPSVRSARSMRSARSGGAYSMISGSASMCSFDSRRSAPPQEVDAIFSRLQSAATASQRSRQQTRSVSPTRPRSPRPRSRPDRPRSPLMPNYVPRAHGSAANVDVHINFVGGLRRGGPLPRPLPVRQR